MINYTRALLIFLLTTTGIFAQINFEKGYFIDQDDQKTECYIKNEDWIYNPSRFEYRLTPNGKTQVLPVLNIKELAIDNSYKYQKHIVEYNDADFEIENLLYERTPDLSYTQLLLKVVVEGEATLYSYRDKNKSTFFYKIGNGNIKTLIYNEYTNKSREILYNKRHQQQLVTELECVKVSEKKILLTDYDETDLSDFIKDYNECKGATSVEYNGNRKNKFHLKVFAGMYNSSSETQLSRSPFFVRGSDESAFWSPTAGLELEYIFPFNRNKWSMFIAPNYTSYEVSSDDTNPANQRTFLLEYSAIQVPVGFRYYMFLDDTSKLFFSGGAVFDIPLQRDISGTVMIVNEIFETAASATFGLGYSFDKYSIEARYILPRNLLGKLNVSTIDMQQFAITLGYTIF
ncbi:MAG: hypothetical protein AAF617_06710 [Bacteroidota bacterium]